jgi:hypothetical protein
MKRIAALAAVTIGLLAIPAAAMASTITPGDPPGADYTSNVQVQPIQCYVGWQKVHHHSKRYFDWWQDGREFTALACPFPKQVSLPAPNQCQGQLLTFSVAPDSSVMTEVSGPQLSPTEQFIYDGNVYTIMSINPGADQFTAFVNNVLFSTNDSTAITNATGIVISCSS